MKLGITVEGQEGLTWERWRRLLWLVEELGFESVWRSDHLLSRTDETQEALETWTSLAVAAVETRRVRFGPLVCPMTFRHPSLLAKMAAAVDRLSGGRLVLGVGAGWNAREHRAFGLPFPPIGERIERMTEGIEVMRRLWGSDPAAYAGRYYQLEVVDALPKPVQRPGIPILIGGRGTPRMLPAIAAYADEWNLTASSPDLVREQAALLNTCCRAAGRDPAAIRRSVAAGFIVWGSDREQQARCEAMRRCVHDLAGCSLSEVPAAARSLGWVCGTPDAIAGSLQGLAAEGVERAMLQVNDREDEAALQLLAREVMPAIA